MHKCLFKCAKCEEVIRENEKCILIHVRHGEEVGRTKGHYNGCCGVYEDSIGIDVDRNFNGSGIHLNNHSEITKSMFYMNDSFTKFVNSKIFELQKVSIDSYIKRVAERDLLLVNYDITKLPYHSFIMENENVNKLAFKKYNELYKNYLKDENNNRCIYLLLTFLYVIDSIMEDFIEDGRWFIGDYCNLKEYCLHHYSGIGAYHLDCFKEDELDFKKLSDIALID